jgi:hypothetical protein
MGSECYPDAHELEKLSALLDSYVNFLIVDNSARWGIGEDQRGKARRIIWATLTLK